MPSSLTTLLPPALGSSPHPPVSVYGTGPLYTIAAFLDRRGPQLRYFFSLRVTSLSSWDGFSCPKTPPLAPVFPLPALLPLPCPRSSDIWGCRNLNLLSIGYAVKPFLRPRLTQSRSALLWKPWIFGLKDSHLHLATHSGILSSYRSTPPYGNASLQ